MVYRVDRCAGGVYETLAFSRHFLPVSEGDRLSLQIRILSNNNRKAFIDSALWATYIYIENHQ